jgi:hypothetical protein
MTGFHQMHFPVIIFYTNFVMIILGLDPDSIRTIFSDRLDTDPDPYSTKDLDPDLDSVIADPKHRLIRYAFFCCFDRPKDNITCRTDIYIQ